MATEDFVDRAELRKVIKEAITNAQILALKQVKASTNRLKQEKLLDKQTSFDLLEKDIDRRLQSLEDGLKSE